MKIEIEIPNPEESSGLQAVWDEEFELFLEIKEGSAILSANKAGLISLARHILLLARDEFPSGHHWHFDDLNSMNEGSAELIIGKF